MSISIFLRRKSTTVRALYGERIEGTGVLSPCMSYAFYEAWMHVLKIPMSQDEEPRTDLSLERRTQRRCRFRASLFPGI